jgi:hypothetical protein
MQKPAEDIKSRDGEREGRRISRAATMARLASHEGFFGEMKRTSRSNSFEDWGHAWIAQDSLPPLPVKRGREERVEVDQVQLRRHALRLCLEQARGSQGIYRADYGVSRERYVESLQEQRGQAQTTKAFESGGFGQQSRMMSQNGNGATEETAHFGASFSVATPSKHNQSEVGAMFAAPPASSLFPSQSTAAPASLAGPSQSNPQAFPFSNPTAPASTSSLFPSSSPAVPEDSVRKRAFHG